MGDMEVVEPSSDKMEMMMQMLVDMKVEQSQNMQSLTLQMTALTSQSAGLSSQTQDLAAKTQVLSEKTQTMSVHLADNANSIHKMSNRLAALEGESAVVGDDGTVWERPAKQAKKVEGGGVSAGASPRRSAGAASSGLPSSLRVPGVPAASYQSAAKLASSAGVPQAGKLWCKGSSRVLDRVTLIEQAGLFVKAVNEEKGTAFKPKVFAWNLEIAASLVFSDGGDAQAFYKASEGVVFTWTDELEGKEHNRQLRIVKDASFDQRCRGQVYYHLRNKLIEMLRAKGMWCEGMAIGNTGPRGVVFVRNKDGRLFEMFRIDTSKRGEGEFLSPTIATTEKFLFTPKEIEELAAWVVKEASLLKKVHVVD